MKQTIDCKCGIFDTQYIFNGKTVKAPYIKWHNNNGNLAFKRIVVADSDMADIRAFFNSDKLVLPANNNAGNLSLSDVLDGNRCPDVHVTIDDIDED